MQKSFCKSGELNGSSFVKIPLRCFASLITENDDRYWFLWSFLAKLHPCEIYSCGVTNYRRYIKELNIESFDFTNGFKYSVVHKIEKLNSFSINIFKLKFYQDQNKWKRKLIPTETSKNR